MRRQADTPVIDFASKKSLSSGGNGYKTYARQWGKEKSRVDGIAMRGSLKRDGDMGLSDHLKVNRLIGRPIQAGPKGRSLNAAVGKGQGISKRR